MRQHTAKGFENCFMMKPSSILDQNANLISESAKKIQLHVNKRGDGNVRFLVVTQE